jgi:hypothetical protein
LFRNFVLTLPRRLAELIFKKPIPRRPLTPEFATDPAFLEVKLLTQT